MKQLAIAGLITRVANTLGPRQALQQTPILKDFVSQKPRKLGNSIGFLYEFNDYRGQYNKYTPYKYRYPNNGRYAKYENIYRDWFNKYGRMRKPKVDPLTLVKDIQWRTYVRWRQSQRMLK